MIIKIKNTKPFNKLTAKMRRKLVRGSYIFNENYDITGKNIILIDDIYTTGATINECSKILKMYGANAVYCATVFSSEFDK
jgi:predicted amidophosphoribosyltransferase